MHTFVTSRLDYRNALYTGLNQSSLTYLKLVQSPLARLLTGTKRREIILLQCWQPCTESLCITESSIKWHC